ncbi:MAG: thioredoxin domain-containing protein [Promethearchaeota archaeon]|nr:MAG: thioredoxin domain-containing protein [Candidatus Lokiarchaeota archaeon]
MNDQEKDNANPLIHEESPYLLQHAHNPVNWYPWGEKAFEKARKEDKPVFLSIGYSTCHWCHVMAHESFEDLEVAKLMNDTLVSIKVDKEERPDIDKIYMTACQVMSGRGGWPLSVFMTPDKKPFFVGTYFPKHSRFGQPGFIDLIKSIKQLWENERKKLLDTSEQATFAIQNATDESPGKMLGKSTLKKAFTQLKSRFDGKYGGFGTKPKFPTPHTILFLLRFWNRTKEKSALEMVEKTLQEMRKGGIFDHIGFGFHRYSTDQKWLVPHFEKMLYDQALLAIAYLETYQATKKEIYANTARDIFTYVLRDMKSPEGAFYSAEDADSEGVEGKFYVWKRGEIYEILNEDDAHLFEHIFNIKEEGNYLEEATKKKTGENILHLKNSYDTISSELGISKKDLKARIKNIRKKLFEYREKRIHPGKDDKILADWNGLMVVALAKGYRILNNEKYLKAAINAIDFITKEMRDTKGRLLHRYRNNKAEIKGFIDDYAFLIWGLLELYEATFNIKYIELALNFNKILIEHFWDDEIGGFYFSADDSENLIIHQKEIYDGAIPSGNSVSMLNLLRLSYILGKPDLEEKAEFITRVFSEKIRNNPTAFTQTLTAVDFGIGPSYSVVISGDKNANDTKRLLNAINSKFMPNIVRVLISTDKRLQEIDDFAEFYNEYNKINEKATAYVCVGNSCKQPTNEVKSMIKSIESSWD